MLTGNVALESMVPGPPLASAKEIRQAFDRTAMNDEKTVGPIAGGYIFGTGHGAADPAEYVGPEPEGASREDPGLGRKNGYGTGRRADTIDERSRRRVDQAPEALGQWLLRRALRSRAKADEEPGRRQPADAGQRLRRVVLRLDLSSHHKVSDNAYERRDRTSAEVKWTETAVDLVFGSDSELRAIAEVHASDDGGPRFVADSIAA